MIIKRLYCCVGRADMNQMIKDAFKNLKGGRKHLGTQLMLQFFKDFPQHEKYFPNFRPMPNELYEESHTNIPHHPDCAGLKANDRLKEHSSKIFAKIEGIVEAIGDDEKLHNALKEVGKIHRHMDLPDQPFNDFKQTLSKFLYAQGCDKKTQRAWDATIPCIMDSIMKFKQRKSEKSSKAKPPKAKPPK